MEAVTLQPRARADPKTATAPDSVGSRMIALMRCMLALSALAIIYLDPTEPARFVGLTYASLTIYCAWSITLFLVADEPGRDWARIGWWADVGCAAFLIALTEGTSSIFFFLFLFAMLVASFTRGYREGLLVTASCVALFLVVGLTTAPSGEQFELNRALIRPVYLFALGWMMAYWGGQEIALRWRLNVLRQVTEEWSPRIGVDRVIRGNLARLLDFFRASRCILLVRAPGVPGARAYDLSAAGEARSAAPTELSEARAAALFALPANLATSHRRGMGEAHPGLEALADVLEAESFATVPYRQGDMIHGRLFVLRRGFGFEPFEIEFMGQLMRNVAHVVQNTQLTEELALQAAAHERFRISLDIHDTTVQPYIGLRLGLDALAREARPGDPLRGRILDLLEMADRMIPDLRDYAADVRNESPMSRDALRQAIQEQARRFARFYGIEVDVRLDAELRIPSHIAGECFRIVSEALTNVLRHTRARRARVEIGCEEHGVRVAVGNDRVESSTPAFTPRSISQRAAALGGTTSVVFDGTYLMVEVRIPA